MSGTNINIWLTKAPFPTSVQLPPVPKHSTVMVSAGSPDPELHDGHSPDFPLNHHYLPQKGEAVEVRSDEEGFVGAWYPATIKSFSKKGKKNAVVRYRTLVRDDDGRTLLTESVDPAFVRPVPPDHGGGGVKKFEVNDAVDAWYKDGWWYGIVRKVHEGNRYRVLFDSPPDAIDFEGEELRFHLDWISGKWVRPEKQRASEGLFSLGMEVEVSLDEGKEDAAWFPAIVVKQNEDQTFMVKYESLNNNCDDAEVKVDMLVVGSHRIRLPSCNSRWDYNLLDHVKANIDGRWQKGKITRVLAGGLYTVLFPQQKEYKDFSWWSLRPDFQWDVGQRKTESGAESKELVLGLRSQEEVDSHCTAAGNLELAVTPVSTHSSISHPEVKTPSSSDTRSMVDDSAVSAKRSASDVLAPSKKKLKMKRNISNDQYFIQKMHEATLLSARKWTEERQAEIHKKYCRKLATVTSNARPTESPVDSSLVSVTDKESNPKDGTITDTVGQPPEYGKLNPPEDQKKESETPGELSSEHNQQGSPERKRERPQELGLIASSIEAEAGIETSSIDNGSEMVVNSVTDKVGECLQQEKDSTVHHGPVEKNANVPEIESSRNEATDMVITPTQGVAEDDRPLSMRFGGIHSSTSFNGDSNGLRDMKPSQVDPATNPGSVCPFVKRSPAWPLMESMEVFTKMPQNPHFLPLTECKEDFREGAAIGLMVTFSNQFEKISKFQINDPMDLFETTLDSLSDLERHGFDVTLPRSRVNKLLSIREPLSKWSDLVKNAERELQMHADEKKDLVAAIEEVENQISALQQTLAEAKAKVDSKEARAAVVSVEVDEMKGCINDACTEFERVAASLGAFNCMKMAGG